VAANSRLDADAEMVEISLDPRYEGFVIPDDGHGMTEKDVNEKSLFVGYRRSDWPEHHKKFRQA